jgi:DNA-binding response OmpR family regulator
LKHPRLDPNAQRTWFQGSRLELLETLMLNAGRVVLKDELLRIAWGEHFAGKVRTVDQHVLQVRHHLHDHARDSKYILTVHGRGYMFVDQPRGAVSEKPVWNLLSSGALAR